jgi:hypothetical protein
MPGKVLRLAVTALLALALVAAVGHAAAKKVTPAGVGQVKLGKKFKKLRAQGLVGKLRKGCPLGGPGARSARLRKPLRGSVDFTRRKPRRAKSIVIRRGARARGVGIGDRIRDIRDAFPGAKVDHRTDETFGITLVKVPRRAGGRIQFAVSVRTKKATLIGVPAIPFCE